MDRVIKDASLTEGLEDSQVFTDEAADSQVLLTPTPAFRVC